MVAEGLILPDGIAFTNPNRRFLGHSGAMQMGELRKRENRRMGAPALGVNFPQMVGWRQDDGLPHKPARADLDGRAAKLIDSVN